jgi:hypothetical protein
MRTPGPPAGRRRLIGLPPQVTHGRLGYVGAASASHEPDAGGVVPASGTNASVRRFVLPRLLVRAGSRHRKARQFPPRARGLVPRLGGQRHTRLLGLRRSAARECQADNSGPTVRSAPGNPEQQPKHTDVDVRSLVVCSTRQRRRSTASPSTIRSDTTLAPLSPDRAPPRLLKIQVGSTALVHDAQGITTSVFGTAKPRAVCAPGTVRGQCPGRDRDRPGRITGFLGCLVAGGCGRDLGVLCPCKFPQAAPLMT